MLISDPLVTSGSRWADAARPGRRIGHAIEFHPSLPSTNDRARALLAEPAGEGVIVVADLQTAGRGRRGRQWVSPAGANLLLSVGVRPRGVSLEHSAWLGTAAALAVVRAAHGWAPLRIRWPNDIVTTDGLKVAGLLVETAAVDDAVAEAIIGIGTNVNWARRDIPAEIAPFATSLSEITGAPVERAAFLGRLLTELDEAISQVEAGLSPVPAAVGASSLIGSAVEVDLGESRISGTASGLAESGALIVETEGRRLELTVGEVVRVRPAGEPIHG